MRRTYSLGFAMGETRARWREAFGRRSMSLPRRRWWIVGALALLLSAVEAGGFAQNFRFPVRHDHGLRSCRGELIITAAGIEYRTAHAKHARRWAFEDIRMVVLASRREIVLHTYEAHRWALGRDRTFRFTTLSEITAEVGAFLLARIQRPLAMGIIAVEGTPLHEIAARHRHRFGGCQGTIRIYADRLVYESRDRPEDSRAWRWSDIRRLGRFGPYRLEITTYEPEFGGPTRAYVFDLKVGLSEEVYDFVWERVYHLTPRWNEQR